MSCKPEADRDDSPCDGCPNLPTNEKESEECELCLQRQRGYR